MLRAISDLRETTPEHVLHVVDTVWSQKDNFVRWPQRAFAFMRGAVRVPYHVYAIEQLQQLRSARVAADRRSNGPAIAAYLLAGGTRPQRVAPGRSWSIHHIYDGQFPLPPLATSVRAVVDGSLFTEAAGLVAIHPVADALADEVPYFAWLLRQEAFERFRFDPDRVFANVR